MDEPKVSVIINTHNRANQLKRLLDCLANQTYDNFEVIVVNGPSTDHTEKVLESYKTSIRVENCPEVNLCKSRNIGVAAAAGEIIAFIDDDAVPQDANWICNAVHYFEKEKVAIVGGAVYRISGRTEFEYGYFSIWGDNIGVNDDQERVQHLEKGWYKGSAGGNVFFRRSAVAEVGGFDEYYTYYMDETDISLRIQQAGYELVHGANMAIIHEAAKSAIRKSPNHLNWDVIARSRCYFTMKASENSGASVEDRRKRAVESCKEWRNSFDALLTDKKITRDDFKLFVNQLHEGCETGMADGISRERQLRHFEDKKNQFLKYDKKISREHLNICMFCEDDILNPRGGVPVYTKALAFGLSARGHNVYVVTKGEETHLSNVDGVNLCYVQPEQLMIEQLENLPISQVRLNFSYSCFLMLQQLKRSFFVQLAESPIWDSYGVVTAYLEKDIPLATRLQTPLKMVMDTFQKQDSPDFEMLMEFETALMQKSQRIITISDCVRHTIENLYGFTFEQKVSLNYLGIDPQTKAVSNRNNDGKMVVFFVGRLERRKGIDSIIASLPSLMEKYPNLEFHFGGDCDIVDDVIGDTYKNKLKKENRGAEWLNRVQFLGKISDEEKEQEFANCDVFASPSLYESFGIIFIEAMRYAKPVIGCKTGGMQEVIADGQTGLLCQPGDAYSFEKCLDTLLQDASLREKMGAAGLERLHEAFSENVMCTRCEEIYRDMLQQQ